MPDRVGQHILYPVRPKPFQHILHSGFGIQPVIAVMAADRLLDGLLAGVARLKRGVILCHLPMLGRIRRRMGIEGRVFQCFLGLIQLVCPGFDGVPYHIHVAGFQLLKVLVNIGQRRGRSQKRLCLGFGQIQFLHAHHDVLPDGVLVGMVQDLRRRLAFQPVAVLVLFSSHLFIKGCQHFFLCHGYRTSSWVLDFLSAALGGMGRRSPSRTEGRVLLATMVSCGPGALLSMLSSVSSSVSRADFSRSSSS